MDYRVKVQIFEEKKRKKQVRDTAPDFFHCGFSDNYFHQQRLQISSLSKLLQKEIEYQLVRNYRKLTTGPSN